MRRPHGPAFLAFLASLAFITGIISGISKPSGFAHQIRVNAEGRLLLL
jgi:hypothetical protein